MKATQQDETDLREIASFFCNSEEGLRFLKNEFRTENPLLTENGRVNQSFLLSQRTLNRRRSENLIRKPCLDVLKAQLDTSEVKICCGGKPRNSSNEEEEEARFNGTREAYLVTRERVD